MRLDQIVNQAAKARFMFGGQAKVSCVIRQPMGMWRSSAAQHSQSLENWWVHIPGLVVITPATPADNYALLKAAIACGDPVIYSEHKDLWPLEGEIPTGHSVAIGRARIAREGRDATLVTWSKTMHVALQAASAAAAKGIEIEVIDLRTLWPWDREAVFASVAKTGRLLVAHESVQVGGFGGEIAATVAEACDDMLEAPVKRLGAPRIPIAYAPPLEDQARVTAGMILREIEVLTQKTRGKRTTA
mgnify:CR=1 FL=1